jgi:hypothetical protein
LFQLSIVQLAYIYKTKMKNNERKTEKIARKKTPYQDLSGMRDVK